MIKKTLFAIYAALMAVMAAATIVGAAAGQQTARAAVYGSWWFCLLWAGGVVAAVAWYWRRGPRRASAVVLHAAFAVILLGALVTHLTGRSGTVRLRRGVPASEYVAEGGSRERLPFTLRLDTFVVSYHAGQASPLDYRSEITVATPSGGRERHVVAMNRIYSGHGTRLCQGSFAEDGEVSVLLVNRDTWGIGITYLGYALLLVGLLWSLADPRGRFRGLLRRPAAVLALLTVCGAATAQRTLTADAAEEMGRAFIVHNGRVCPVQTFALDFTRKMTGSSTYRGLSACQVLAGVMLYPSDWLNEPFMRLRGGELRRKLGVGKMVAPGQLLGSGYVLGPMLSDARAGKLGKLGGQVLDADDRLMLLMQVARGELLRLFPYPDGHGGPVVWRAPSEAQPKGMPAEQAAYVRDILPLAARLAAEGRHAEAKDVFARLRRYQATYGAGTLPSVAQVRAERGWNAVPWATVLFVATLSLGALSALWLARGRRLVPFRAALAASWVVLSAALAMRWVAQGSVPMGNGYETMLLLAWLVMLLALCGGRRARALTPLGLLSAGLMLLVSHLGQMDPAITPRMPVLNSPLLALHVSVVMLGYALLTVTMALSVAWMVMPLACRGRAREARARLKPLSELFLWPAVAALAAGIFLGAVWANVSWGSYWSWDPKETWALITLMAYAVPLHQGTVRALSTDRGYHTYVLLAFGCLVVTYFGVNYLMPGMHSYA